MVVAAGAERFAAAIGAKIGIRGGVVRAFRFFEQMYADALVRDGTLKIGTIAGYRPADGKPLGGRSDEMEGIRIYQPGAVAVSADKLGNLIDLSDLAAPLSIEVLFDKDAKMIIHRDAYMVSLCSKITKLMVCRMRDEFGYDACIEVRDISSFAEAVTCSDHRLKGTVGRSEPKWGAGPVTYKNVDPKSHDREETGLIKRPEYRWQNEWRIIWPASPPHQPFVTEVKGIEHLVRAVDLSRWQ